MAISGIIGRYIVTRSPFCAQGLQSVRALADTLVKFTVTDVFRNRRIIALPDDRGFIAAGFQVAVQTIARDIQFPIVEPTNVAILICEARVFDP